MIKNKNNELIPTRNVTGHRVYIEYRKLNTTTRNDHFPLLFIDQILERLAGHSYYCFLDGFSDYFQIPIIPEDQHKITYTCSHDTFSYQRMPFRLCNAPATFQRCMTFISTGDFMEVFMDDFSMFGDNFEFCLKFLKLMLKCCVWANLLLNWEKIPFTVEEGIVLGHKIFKIEMKVDKVKIEVISKLPSPWSRKALRCFLGHAGFDRRFWCVLFIVC